MELIELLGIFAGLFVLGSFVLRGEIKIRVVNSFGCALFATYGIIIGAWSVWILNVCLMIVHFYYLIKSRKKKVDVKEEALA
jgi:hypothetical protein